jgi:hypothetical protein
MEILLNDIAQYALTLSAVLLGLEFRYVTNVYSQLSGQHFPTPHGHGHLFLMVCLFYNRIIHVVSNFLRLLEEVIFGSVYLRKACDQS